MRLLLVLAVAFGLAACGGSSDNDKMEKAKEEVSEAADAVGAAAKEAVDNGKEDLADAMKKPMEKAEEAGDKIMEKAEEVDDAIEDAGGD
jgi:CRISPR/Cas system-associated protein Cas7 (RAMP superfamily)